MHHASEILGSHAFERLLGDDAFAVARERAARARMQAALSAALLLRTRHERRITRQRAALQQAGVPSGLWPAITGRREPTASLLAVEALQGPRCLVVLTGPGDASKSTAAGLVLLRHGGLWVDSERLLDLWLGGKATALIEASALVLDDFGRPGGSVDQRAASAEASEQLLHLRSQAGRITVVTSNYGREVLRAFVTVARAGAKPAGERWERLRERLRQFGAQPDETALRRLGGQLEFAGFVLLPYEGLRDQTKRRQVLAEREGRS